jgi:hypothetical protein
MVFNMFRLVSILRGIASAPCTEDNASTPARWKPASDARPLAPSKPGRNKRSKPIHMSLIRPPTGSPSPFPSTLRSTEGSPNSMVSITPKVRARASKAFMTGAIIAEPLFAAEMDASALLSNP